MLSEPHPVPCRFGTLSKVLDISIAKDMARAWDGSSSREEENKNEAKEIEKVKLALARLELKVSLSEKKPTLRDDAAEHNCESRSSGIKGALRDFAQRDRDSSSLPKKRPTRSTFLLLPTRRDASFRLVRLSLFLFFFYIAHFRSHTL